MTDGGASRGKTGASGDRRGERGKDWGEQEKMGEGERGQMGFLSKMVERENKLPLANVLDVLDVVSRYHGTRGSHSPRRSR